MMTQISVRDARANLAELLGRATDHHERIVLTVHGKPTAVLLGIDDFESVMETLDLLSSPEAVAQVQESQQELADGEGFEVPPGMTLGELRAAG